MNIKQGILNSSIVHSAEVAAILDKLHLPIQQSSDAFKLQALLLAIYANHVQQADEVIALLESRDTTSLATNQEPLLRYYQTHPNKLKHLLSFRFDEDNDFPSKTDYTTFFDVLVQRWYPIFAERVLKPLATGHNSDEAKYSELQEKSQLAVDVLHSPQLAQLAFVAWVFNPHLYDSVYLSRPSLLLQFNKKISSSADSSHQLKKELLSEWYRTIMSVLVDD